MLVHRFAASFCFASLFLILTGCPGADDGMPGTGMPGGEDIPDDEVPPLGADPYASEEFCVTLAHSQCNFLYECCNANERVALGQFGFGFNFHDSKNECIIDYVDLCESFYAATEESVDEGRVAWDRDLFETCAEPLLSASESCDAEQFFTANGNASLFGLGAVGESEECRTREYIEGQVDNGDLCYSSAECQSEGAVCQPKTSEDPNVVIVTIAGSCEPPPPPAAREEPCGYDDDSGDYVECEDDLTCTYTSFTEDQICLGNGRDGDLCTYSNYCADNFYCNDEDSPPTCRAKLSNGEVCDFFDEACQSDRCDYDSATGEYICIPKADLGEDCGYHSDCQSGNCFYDEENFTSTCVASLDAGDVCEDDLQCGDGNCRYDADEGDSLCFDPLALGDPCDDDEECASDYCYYDICQDPENPVEGNPNEMIQYDICKG